MQTLEIQSTLSFRNSRTYLLALLFVVGNILLPQIAHLLPNGGQAWLPIYFFTLIGAYRYGWKVGVMTAVFSPIANHLLFGMPGSDMLPGILIKSLSLAFAAAIFSRWFRKVSLLSLLAVIISYQFIGCMAEWVIFGSLSVALNHILIAIPGMLFQLFGGYLILRHHIIG